MTHSITLAADIVVFGYSPRSTSLRVLMIHRLAPPFKGSLALPGGRVEPDEDAEAAALRELEEETGIKPTFLEQLYTFTAPDRDPRGRVVSVAYYALVSVDQFTPVAGTDAADADWYTVDDVLQSELAFDHKEVLLVALERLRGKISYCPLGIELLPDRFSVTELRQVYEVVLGRKLDNGNFRRRILKLDLLVPTSEQRRTVTKPAALYEFNKAKYEAMSTTGWNFEI